jgi:hypothetical protein
MDHAAAHERIEDLLLDPARLAALQTSGAPADVALREHVAGCPTCRADLEGWQRLGYAIADALPADAVAALAAVEPVEMPPSLRTSVLAAVQGSGGAGAPVSIDDRRRDGAARASDTRTGGAPNRWRRLAPWTALAAAVAVMLGFGALTIDQATQRAHAAAEAAALPKLAATVQDVLATEHVIVPLQRTDGSNAGSISWSRHDWVVLTNALPAPPAGSTYRCWLEDGGKSVAVGEMEFAGSTAYWAANLDDWQTWEIGDTTKFVVSLEAGAPASRTGDVILSADLGS